MNTFKMGQCLIDYLNDVQLKEADLYFLTKNSTLLPKDLPTEIKEKIIKMIQIGLIVTDIQLYKINKESDLKYYFPYIGFYIKSKYYKNFILKLISSSNILYYTKNFMQGEHIYTKSYKVYCKDRKKRFISQFRDEPCKLVIHEKNYIFKSAIGFYLHGDENRSYFA